MCVLCARAGPACLKSHSLRFELAQSFCAYAYYGAILLAYHAQAHTTHPKMPPKYQKSCHFWPGFSLPHSCCLGSFSSPRVSVRTVYTKLFRQQLIQVASVPFSGGDAGSLRLCVLSVSVAIVGGMGANDRKHEITFSQMGETAPFEWAPVGERTERPGTRARTDKNGE